MTSAKIADGTIVNADVNASAAIDVSKLSGVVASATVGNLFPANVATGTDTLGDTTGFFADASTLASSTDYALVGSKSLKATMTGAAGIIYAPGANTSGIPVAAGATYTGQFALRSSAARSTFARIYWYTSGGSPISSVESAAVNSSTSGWTVYAVTGVAPATAAYGTVIAVTSGNTVGDVHYLDSLGFWAGAGGVWVPPGVPVPNLGLKTDNTAGKASYLWDDTAGGWRLIAYDSGRREVTSALEAAHLSANPNARMWVQRRLSTVSVWYDSGTSPTSTGIQTVWTCPTGFQFQVGGLTTYNMGQATDTGAGLNVGQGLYVNSVAVRTFGWVSGTRQLVQFNYPAADSIPTVLPGTLYTAPV